MKWYMDNMSVRPANVRTTKILTPPSFIGSVEQYSSAGLMWNIALDGNGQPMYPGTDSCGGGCRGIATVNSDGSYSVNQECASLWTSLLKIV